MSDKRPDGVEEYGNPAGGWDALKAVAKTLKHQQIVTQGSATLLKANQPAVPAPASARCVAIPTRRGQDRRHYRDLNKALIDGMERAFGFRPSEKKGHNAIESIEAIAAGKSKALICLGGNLAVAMSDPDVTFEAMRKLDLAVHIATKLNRSHLLTAKTSIILPCLGRADLDTQATGPQAITVEDSMSMVHASRGFLKPPSELLKSEPAIIAGIAIATLGTKYGIDWTGLIANYDRIRDKIEAVFPDFHEFNSRVRARGGFRLDVPASYRLWKTERKGEFPRCPRSR